MTLFFNYPLHYALRKIEEAPKCQLWVHLIRKKYHFTRLNISFALSVSILVLSSVSGRVDAKQAKVKWRSPRHPGDLDPATGWEAAKQTRGRRWGSERRHIRGGDKLGEMFTLRIHYANEDFFLALPSRNHHAVDGDHAGDNVVVALQAPQAEPRPLPGWPELREFVFCERKIERESERESERKRERDQCSELSLPAEHRGQLIWPVLRLWIKLTGRS